MKMTRLERKYLAESNKFATESFMEAMTKELNIHFIDVEYLDEPEDEDDYGTNSIVNFHIEECPNWKFGIWWEEPKRVRSFKWYKGKEFDYSNLHGDFFAQHEFDIDKFKPSRSENISFIVANNIDTEDGYYYEASRFIQYIKDHSELAFCKDYKGWDYNKSYHTEKEAKKVFNDFVKWRAKKLEKTEEYDKKILSFVKEKVMPSIKDCFIIDSGDDCSPRYELAAKYESNKDTVDEPGCYGWFEDDDPNGESIMKEFKELVRECEDDSDKYEFLYYPCLNDSVIMIDNNWVEHMSKHPEHYKIIEV